MNTTGSYPDLPDLCVWGWVGTTCAGEHREDCGCPGTPSFRHRDDCHCYDPPVMRTWYEMTCPMCAGSGKVADRRRGPVQA
jgi:hypothetical protein